MATAYKSSGANLVGLVSTPVCQISDTRAFGICAGINVANTTGVNNYVSVYLLRGDVITHIAHELKLGAGENAELVKGKITLLPSDALYAVGSVPNGLDVLVSYLEGI
jgi:hypothetical protein